MPSHYNAYVYLQEKDSCGIEFERHLANKVVEKASVKGYVPQVATDTPYVEFCKSNDCSTIKDIPRLV